MNQSNATLLEDEGTNVGGECPPLLVVIVGCVFTITAFCALFLYTRVLLIFLTDREFKHSLTHRLIFHLGLFDSIQLTIHGFSGIALIVSVFGFNISDAYWLDKLIGAIVEGGWIPVNTASFVLAVERFLQMIKPHYVDVFFNQRIVKVIIFVYWSIYLLVLSFCLSPLASYMFFVSDFAFSYSEDEIMNKEVDYFDDIYTLTLCVPEAILYASIVRHILHTSEGGSSFERPLTIQFAIMYSYELSVLICWIVEERFPFYDEPLYHAFSNYLWIIFNSMRPALYLIFNKKLRRKIRFLPQREKIEATKPNASVMLNSGVNMPAKSFVVVATNVRKERSAFHT